MSEILDGAGKNEKNFDQNGRKAKAVHRNEKTKPELCRSVQKHSWAFSTPRYERGKKTGLNPTIQNNTPLSIHGPAFFSAIRGNSS
ncbi:MAG: hypothetical protein L6Q71_09270, partial [Planctomycetes bacterium]|nr:hypothetical protein [Planctomycetota bacterium]